MSMEGMNKELGVNGRMTVVEECIVSLMCVQLFLRVSSSSFGLG